MYQETRLILSIKCILSKGKIKKQEAISKLSFLLCLPNLGDIVTSFLKNKIKSHLYHVKNIPKASMTLKGDEIPQQMEEE